MATEVPEEAYRVKISYKYLRYTPGTMCPKGQVKKKIGRRSLDIVHSYK